MNEVERDAIDVMFIRTPDEVAEFGRAFQRLEELVGTRGRKFFGAFYPREKEYRACVQFSAMTARRISSRYEAEAWLSPRTACVWE
jgi:hypothetical protein